ncbi:MAG: SRPBCC family protein [Chloroflexota bacterium]|nr:SRPBCC family protein [Chloroflexota bacterium]
MRRVQGTVFIAASPAEVYAFLSEPTNVPRWQTGVVSSERTSPAPTVTGSTGRVVLEVMGQRVTAETTVREAVPDKRLVLAASVSGMSVVGSLDLVAVEGGTKVTFSSEVKAESIFMAPLERLVTDGVEQDLDASLARLSAALAAETGA